MLTSPAVLTASRQRPPAPPAPDATTADEAVAGEQRPRALVVEDDESFCSIISIVLRQAAIDCDIARDASSARSLLEQRRYDAYVIDLRLPDCYDDEVVALVMANDPEASRKAVVVTAFPVTAAAFAGGLPVVDKASLAGLREFIQSIRGKRQ